LITPLTYTLIHKKAELTNQINVPWEIDHQWLNEARNQHSLKYLRAAKYLQAVLATSTACRYFAALSKNVKAGEITSYGLPQVFNV